MDRQPAFGSAGLKGAELLAASYATAFATNCSASQWTKVAELETKNAAMWSLLQERDRRIHQLENDLSGARQSAEQVTAEKQRTDQVERLVYKQVEDQLATVSAQRDQLSAEVQRKTEVAQQLVAALSQTKEDVSALVHGAVAAYTEQLELSNEENRRLQTELDSICGGESEADRISRHQYELSELELAHSNTVEQLESANTALDHELDILNARLDEMHDDLRAAEEASGIDHIERSIETARRELESVVSWIEAALEPGDRAPDPSMLLAISPSRSSRSPRGGKPHKNLSELNSATTKLRDMVLAKYAEDCLSDANANSCGVQ